MKHIKRTLILMLCLTLMIPAAVGEEAYRPEGGFAVTLYYPSVDKNGLISVEATVAPQNGETFVRALILKLMEEPEGAGADPLFGKNARIAYIEDSLAVVTVSVETHTPTEARERALGALAVWKTLSENTQTEGVNVIVDSCAVSYGGKTLNTMLTVRSEAADFESLLTLALENRAYTVYLPLADGNNMLPVLRPVIEGTGDEDALLGYLSFYEDEGGYLCVWPGDFSLRDGTDLRYDFSSRGRRRLNFAYADQGEGGTGISEALQFSSMQRWQFLAMLSLTFTTNIADVERVTVKLRDVRIQSITDADGAQLEFPDGEIPRRLFRDSAAAAARRLTWEEDSGAFVLSDVFLSGNDASDARNILLASLGGLIGEKDINRVEVGPYSACVDVSAVFYARARSLNAAEERKLLYAIVDALNVDFGITQVRFSVEGMDYVCEDSVLEMTSPLRPNYGLLK